MKDLPKYDNTAKKTTANKETFPLFEISLPQLVLVSFLTFGMYYLYWTYVNWRYIANAPEQGKISPFWRTFFNLFYAYPLYKRIMQAARSRGFSKHYSPGGLFLLGLLNSIVSAYLVYHVAGSMTRWSLVPVLISFIISLVPMMLMQQAASYNNAQLPEAERPSTEMSTTQRVFVLLAALYGAYTYNTYLFVLPYGPSYSEQFRQAQENANQRTNQTDTTSR